MAEPSNAIRKRFGRLKARFIAGKADAADRAALVAMKRAMPSFDALQAAPKPKGPKRKIRVRDEMAP